MNWLTTCRLKRNETLPQGNRLHKVGHEFPNIKFHPLSASYRGEFVAVTMDVVWLPCRMGVVVVTVCRSWMRRIALQY